MAGAVDALEDASNAAVFVEDTAVSADLRGQAEAGGAGMTGGTLEVALTLDMALVVETGRANAALEVEETDACGVGAAGVETHHAFVAFAVFNAAAITSGARFFFGGADAAIVASESRTIDQAVVVSRAGASGRTLTNVALLGKTVAISTVRVARTGWNLGAVSDVVVRVSVVVVVKPVLAADAGLDAAILVIHEAAATHGRTAFITL
jgi:hypothetical protein